MTTRDGSISALKDKAGSASRALSRRTSVRSRFLKDGLRPFLFAGSFCIFSLLHFFFWLLLFFYFSNFSDVGLEDAQSEFYTLALYITSHPPIEAEKGFLFRLLHYASRYIVFLLTTLLSIPSAANAVEKEMLNVHASTYIQSRTALPCPKPSLV